MKKCFKFRLSLLVIFIFLLQGNYVYAEGIIRTNIFRWLSENEGLLRVLIVILIPMLFKSAEFIFNLPLKAFQNDISTLNKDNSLIPSIIMSGIPLFFIILAYESNLSPMVFIPLVIYLLAINFINKRIKSLNEKDKYIEVNSTLIDMLKYSGIYTLTALIIIFIIVAFKGTGIVNVIGILYALITALSISGASNALYLIYNFKPYKLELKDNKTEKDIYILAETKEFIVIKRGDKKQRPTSLTKNIIKEISPMSDGNEKETRQDKKSWKDWVTMAAVVLSSIFITYNIAKPMEVRETDINTNGNKAIEYNINQGNKLEINYFDENGEVRIKRKNVLPDNINNIFLELIEDKKLND